MVSYHGPDEFDYSFTGSTISAGHAVVANATLVDPVDRPSELSQRIGP
jgi:hypothetical protein